MTVVSSSNFLRGYGGVGYLAEALATRGVRVRAIAPIPPDQLAEARHFTFTTRSIYGLALRSPWLSRRLFHLWLIMAGALRGGNWLFSDLSFFREAVAIRRLRPHSRLVHYCPELLTPEEFPNLRNTSFYAKHASVPDLIIDVDPARAALRRERFGLLQEVMVLPNTLPRAELPAPAPSGALAHLAGGDLPPGVPILLYAGAVHEGTALDRVVAALGEVRQPVFFLAFCHSSHPAEVLQLAELVGVRLGPHRGRVCASVPRRQLLACMHQATLGLAYYPYSAAPSWGQLHCAPAKVFEYLATGVPVVASANPTMRELVADRSVGVCAADDDPVSLAKAIAALLREPDVMRAMSERARNLFTSELCFERAAVDVTQRILAVFDGAGSTRERGVNS